MAHHSETAGRRGRGRPLLVTALVALLVVGLVVSWLQARDRVGHQADQAAGACVEGSARVPIVASPDIAPALEAIAKRFNATRPVARDHCVSVQIRPGDSKVTLEGLRGAWDATALGERPAAWIPQSSVWAAELATGKPGSLEDSTTSLVTSPVVLAMPTAFADKAAGKLGWGDLPPLAKRPDAMAQFGLATWGRLGLAMPLGASSDATVLAAQAIAAQLVRASRALTAAEAASPAVVAGIQAVLAGAPPAPEGTAAATVAAMNAATDPRRGIHAVPITEQQLFQISQSGALGEKIIALFPSGPTPVADYPVLRLTDPAVTVAESDGVAQFLEYAKRPEQLATLTALGYRASGATLPTGNATVAFSPVDATMPIPEPAASAAITRLVYR